MKISELLGKELTAKTIFDGYDGRTYDARATLTIEENGQFCVSNYAYLDPKINEWIDIEDEYWDKESIEKTFDVEIDIVKKTITTEKKLREWLSGFDISHFEKAPSPAEIGEKQPMIEPVDLLEEPDMIFVEDDPVDGWVVLDAGEKVRIPEKLFRESGTFDFYCIVYPGGNYENRLFESEEEAKKFLEEKWS